MSQTERYYKIDQLLHDRKIVSFTTLMEELGISRATLKRERAIPGAGEHLCCVL